MLTDNIQVNIKGNLKCLSRFKDFIIYITYKNIKLQFILSVNYKVVVISKGFKPIVN